MSNVDSIISRLRNSIYGESMRDAIVDLAELDETNLKCGIPQYLSNAEKTQVRKNIGAEHIRVNGTTLLVEMEESDDFYNRWIWKVSDEQFMIFKCAMGYDSTANVIRLQTSTPSQNRRSIGVATGIVPFKVGNSDEDSIYYPIPVPIRASKVTIQIAPSTTQLAMHINKLVEGNKFIQTFDSGWSDPGTFVFEDGKNNFFTMGLRANSNNSNFTNATEPTEIVIQFSV